jgi:hypothetical protein
MIFYYAIGDGLGHLTRARAVLHTLGIFAQAAIITASEFAADARVCAPLSVVRVPKDLARDFSAYRAWLAKLFAEVQPSALYLDAFPAGICGEFNDFPPLKNLETIYVARLLKWRAYEKFIGAGAPHFTKTFRLEPLSAEHQKFVAAHSNQISHLTLSDPPPVLTEQARARLAQFRERQTSFWLIVHAGDEAEIHELAAFAEEMQSFEKTSAPLLLAAPRRPNALSPRIQHIDFYPARLLFPFAARIITACGFNVMRQTAAYRARHRFVPFPRRFDDQFARAARCA